MTIFFISDTHFGHDNIIRYCDRPFTHAAAMDDALIKNWHARVRPNDHIYHLGDVTMDRGGRVQQQKFIALIKSLPGHKRLLLGNHDHFPIKTYIEAGFEKIYGTWRGIENILLSHFPVHPGSIGSAIANVHGHIHNQPAPKAVRFEGYETPWNIDSSAAKGRVTPYVNISVEMTNYAPISLEELKERIRVAAGQ